MSEEPKGKPQAVRLDIDKLYEEVRPPLGGVTWAGVSRVDKDVVLELGYADIPGFALDIQRGQLKQGYRLKVRICGTYLLSPGALANLYATTLEVFSALKGELGLQLPKEALGEQS